MAKQIICLILIAMLVSQGTSEDTQCKNLEGLGVLAACHYSIRLDLPEVSPSLDCCKAVKTIGMKCVCDIVTEDIEKTIDMKKLVGVASVCGQPLAPASQCGTYKVPGA